MMKFVICANTCVHSNLSVSENLTKGTWLPGVVSFFSKIFRLEPVTIPPEAEDFWFNAIKTGGHSPLKLYFIEEFHLLPRSNLKMIYPKIS